MAENETELSDYKKRQKETELLREENATLLAQVQKLQSNNGYIQNKLDNSQSEHVQIKAKLDALNEIARINLVKKSIESESLEKLQAENDDLKFQVGHKNGQIENLSGFKFDLGELKKSFADLKSEKTELENNLKFLNENSILDKQRFESLKEIETNSNGQILGLQKKLSEFNEFKTAHDRTSKEKEAVLNSLNVELAKLKNENAIYKEAQGKENSKMYAFKVVVIFLAVLANYLLLGKKFLDLTGEKDWQTYAISYGSVLIFDLTVILLTLLNKSKEALYFAIGVFILTFFHIAKPFQGLGLNVDFWGFDLVYFERVVSGGIYSVFFAVLPYFLSKITKDSNN